MCVYKQIHIRGILRVFRGVQETPKIYSAGFIVKSKTWSYKKKRPNKLTNFRRHKCFQVACFKRVFYFVGKTIVRNDKTILRLFRTQTVHHLPGKIVLLYKGG